MLNKNLFDTLFIAETKINSTVSSSLLSQQAYRIVRKDRKKGFWWTYSIHKRRSVRF